MATLEDAIELAARAHRGQKDKAGAPYLLHPLRMMLRMASELEMMVAVLHDVVEDTDWSLADLREAGYPEAVVEAIDCLTRREGESYDAFIQRVNSNALARKVKVADLEDNMDLRRIRDPQPGDMSRMERYRRAWARLTHEETP